MTAFQQYLGTAHPRTMPMSAGLALFALVLMCWPARPAAAAPAPRPHGPAAPPAVENA
jgi:hypothetical protein